MTQLRTLYDPIEPYDRGRLKVSDIHEIYYEQCGNPNGKPVVYVGDKGRWRRVEVEIVAHNPDELAVRGIEGGQMVALSEPEMAGARK